jgi:hypothetical protein
VQRQYTGTAGKVDNAQVAVYLTYATSAGHGVIDRELYLPQGWLADAERCRAAGVPAQRAFATKPELARVMLQRVLDTGVPAGWVTADEVYGGDPALRGWLEAHEMPYVLAVKCTEPLPSPSGPPAPAARLAEHIPPACWLRISAGQGAKGRRWYAWSRLPLSTADAPHGWQRCAAASLAAPGTPTNAPEGANGSTPRAAHDLSAAGGAVDSGGAAPQARGAAPGSRSPWPPPTGSRA